MKFPLDNDHRRSAGVKTGAIHDSTGSIVMSVNRVKLAKLPDETYEQWNERETQATVERASAIVRFLNSAHRIVSSMEKHEEQPWLPGVDKPDEEDV